MELAELQQMAEAERATMEKLVQVRCCTAAGCLSSGSGMVRDALSKAVADRGFAGKVHVASVGCMKLCCEGPLVQVDPAGVLYERLKPEDAALIVDGAARETTSKSRLRTGDPKSPFFTKQQPIVLENSGITEPERIESYLAAGGYEALYQALHEMTPAAVIEEMTKSGLRGRGGAGYPTGLKWGQVAKQPAGKKFVICNADEGDPGAFMDRSVLESDPHRVLEGMAIAAYAVGSDQGYIYVRGEYPLAIHRLQTAIRQARRLGILGGPVFGSGVNFRVDLRIGAGAFVCGEETALIASIEG
ncbi:MAG TPA: NADH-quinone oxidoreductase subunit L, partial [Gemmataceae bacterium]|nr:NADH-quinone oxidoreductase subunit L [Gemmataceae bacterium]